MDISIDTVKALRDATGISIMQCKKALEEAGGDIEKAKIILRKSGLASAAQKADRKLGAGVAQAYVHAGNTTVGVVVLSCETDFVAKNKEFVDLAYDIAMHVAAMAPEFISREDVTDENVKAAREVFEKESKDKPENIRKKIVDGKMDDYLSEKVLLEQKFVKNPDLAVHDLVQEAVHKFGEKIAITNMARLSVK